MYDYRLYYWQVPFRGNFIQLLLEEAGCQYQRLDASKLYPKKALKLKYPGMAPPYLYDCRKRVYLEQMPAIMMYLGEKHNLLPRRIETKSLCLKLIAD